MNPEAPKKLPTPDWSKPMGIAGLVHAMSAAMLANSWGEAAMLARKVELLILDEGEES